MEQSAASSSATTTVALPSSLPHFVVRPPFLRGLPLPERRFGAPFAVDAEEPLRDSPFKTAAAAAAAVARSLLSRNSSQSQSLTSGSGPRFVIRVRALRKVSTRGKINVGKAVSMINNDQ